MTFKEWMLLEDISSGDNDLTGDLFYPTQAGDYPYASNDPHEHRWLQWKWDQEKKQGRPFHNIDQEEFEKRRYTNVKSNTMPEAGSGFWKHKPDSENNLEIEDHEDLLQYGVWKNTKEPNFLGNAVMIQVVSPLDKIFGDKPSGQWQDQAVNTRWNEEIIRSNTGFRDFVNTDMGIPSKYVGPDETGEKGQKPVKIADFGFNPKKRRRKHK